MLTFTYFSHLLMFGITLAVIGLELITHFVAAYTKQGVWKVRRTSRYLLALTMAAFFPLTLAVFYLLNHQVTTGSEWLSTLELKEWVKNFRPLIAINKEKEQVFTTKLFYIFLILLSIGVYQRLQRVELDLIKGRWKELRTQLLDQNDVFLFGAGLLFFAYFILPNSAAYAGFFSVRLLQLGLLVAIVWIAKQRQSSLIIVSLMAFVLYINFKLFLFYKNELYSQQAVINNIQEASLGIVPGSTVLPIDLSVNWLDAHYSNYLGAEKPMVILDNYEAGVDYFPIKWNDTIPRTHLGDPQFTDDCLLFPHQATGTAYMADYVFLLGKGSSNLTDSCKTRLDNLLKLHYKPIYDKDNVRLYEKSYETSQG